MSIKHALSFAAVLAVSATVQAQDCAQGPQGGMDMNGDECSTAVTQIEHPLHPAVWAAIQASMHLARQASSDAAAPASAPASVSIATVAQPLTNDRSPDSASGTDAVSDLSDY